MACFLVPTGEAIVASIVKRSIEAKGGSPDIPAEDLSDKTPWKTKLSWLTSMLWGGAVLLTLEHIWHGEVVLYPPFLTAMNDPADTAVMLQEMGTVGVGMAVFVTATWLVMVLAYDSLPALRGRIAGEGA